MSNTVKIIVDGVEHTVKRSDLEGVIPEINFPKLNEHQLSIVNLLYCLTDYYYEDMGNSAGGALHIVLDDYNYEDESIKHCFETCKAINDPFGMAICETLMLLPEDVREYVLEEQWYYRSQLKTYHEKLSQRLSDYYDDRRQKQYQDVRTV